MDQELEKAVEIWIVEDDEEFLEILTNYLSKTDRIIKSFKCGKDLLVEIKKSSFDILLADLVIPDIDGIEILKIAKRFNPDSIVIIMTGYASLDSAIQAIRGGAYDYIRKPFRLEELEIVIHNAIEKIYLKRDNIKLLNKLERMMQDLKHLKRLWEERLINVIEKWYQSSEHQGNKEIELILKQIFPIPPDYEIKTQERKENSEEIFKYIIESKRKGLVNFDDFNSFLKVFLERLINQL